MYQIHHRRNYDTPSDYSVHSKDGKYVFETLKEASNARFCSGDLVVYMNTLKVVTEKEWLWDWELQDPNCYAQRAIKWVADGKHDKWEEKEIEMEKQYY